MTMITAMTKVTMGDYDDSGDSAAEGGDDGCLDNAILN